MGLGIRGGVARQLQTLLEAGAIGSMDDVELLARFRRRDDSAELAFADLVDRHGGMVLRICLDILGDSHEAQDATQATFFILARKSDSIRKPEALPSWLHGTARRVAKRALRDSIRRRRHEQRCASIADKRPVVDDSPQGWHELHEELARLPDRYREPIILCDLAGLTHEQAAGKLGCPPRTLETRLYRGRERLKDRLVRRGVGPMAALVGVARASESQAAISPSWVASTAGAAVRMVGKGGWAAAGEVSTNAVRWARGHIKETAMFKLKLVLASGLLLGLAWQLIPSNSVDAKVQAKLETPPRKAEQPPADPPVPKTDTHPITITGRAFDPNGKPIADARVYLASRSADYKRVAETTTDFEGRYEFLNVPLPIEHPQANEFAGRDQGSFQVFGEAEGFGFAFRPQKWFHPKPRPSNITEEPDRIDPPGSYEATDKIVLDLQFPPAARLAGTVVDDHGNPLPNMSLAIRGCETGVLLVDTPIWSFDALNERDSAPASMKLRTTDALGRFEFQGMPANCRFRIHVSAKGFPQKWVLAATADRLPQHYLGEPVETGELKITMAIPLDIPIKMIFADTKKPAAKVAVQAMGMNVSILQSSNDQGLATLRLPPGKYRMSNWPARGMPYLVTKGELIVGEKSPVEPLVYTLRPAAILEVTVVDKATGEGLAGVDIWQGDVPGNNRKRFLMPSWEEATRIAWQDSPRTDAQGKLRAFVEPGLSRFGIANEASPRGYFPDEREGQEVECRAGETTSIKFMMRNVKP